MANKFQVKRTSISGRTPNTTNSGNTHYIDTGELAINLADGKMFSSNGTAYFEVGANLSNLSVTGNASIGAIVANGTIGSVGQTLTSNGTGIYWATGAGTGTVTQVNTGIGLSGGPITSTGTIDILANTGIIANTTGLYVNSSYIATISSNNSFFLGGVAAASYVQNTDSRTLSGNLVISGTSFTPSSNTVLLGNSTQRWQLSANTGDFTGTVTGTVANMSTSVNSALLTVGTSFIANTIGVFHTGTVNAASFTTSGLRANTTALVPTSNTILLGNTIGRWIVSANTGNFSGALSVSGNTTLAGDVAITSGTLSGNNSTGALKVTGGVGVGDSVYVKNRVGFTNSTNISVVYQVYNETSNSLDTVFG